MGNKLQTKHLDTKEIIGRNLLVKYHSDRPPNTATKKFLRKSVDIAGSVMLSTVWQIDKIVLFRMDEKPWMTTLLDKHFCMNRSALLASTMTKGKLDNSKARRDFLGKIRKVMLSTSFHLNTGVYLLDVDAGHRTTVGDFDIVDLDAGWKEAAPAGSTKPHVVSKNIEGYAQGRDHKRKSSGEEAATSSGPIHVSFALATSYSPEQMARIIIHEATHSFSYTKDVKYCWDANYDMQDPFAMLDNADSYAFAALSIRAKKMLDSAGLKTFSYT